MLAMITTGKLKPKLLVDKTIGLEQAIAELVGMDQFQGVGTTVIIDF